MNESYSQPPVDKVFAAQAGEAKAAYSSEIRTNGAEAVCPEILRDPRMAQVNADPHLIVIMNVAQNKKEMSQKGEAS